MLLKISEGGRERCGKVTLIIKIKKEVNFEVVFDCIFKHKDIS